jgi:preprotein translocase subunit YajC
MNLLMNVPLLLAATTKSSSKSGGGSATFLLFIVVLGAAAYFLLLRPQQQKARKQREATSAVAVGDEVLTAGGIVGRILELDDDRVTILTGESNEEGVIEGTPTRIVMVRNAILRKVDPVPVDTGVAEAELHHDEDDEEPEEYEDEGHEETGT